MVQDMNSDLDDINEWSAQNRMIINTDKTKSILITGKRIENKLPSDTSIALAIKLDDTQIDQVSCQKLLGVINLNYEAHIDHLCKKLSKQLGLPKYISPYLKRSYLISSYLKRETYFNDIIKQTLMYGSVILIKRTTLAFKRANTSYCTPSYLDSLLVRKSDVHSRETRYSKFNMSCPRYKRKTEGGKTFAVRTIID